MAANNGQKTALHSAKEVDAHILVIRLSAMGDVAMTLPVLAALLDKYPDLKITVLTRKFFAPMFSSLKQVTVFEADLKGKHKGFIGLWKLFTELKKLEPAAIADVHNVLRTKVIRFFFSFTSIKAACIDKGRPEKRALISDAKKIMAPLKSTHLRYADVFQKLGYEIGLDGAYFQPKRTLSDAVLVLAGTHNIKWLGIAPFAAFTGKMYPLKMTIKILQILNNTNKYKYFLFGGGSKEVQQLQGIAEKCSNAIVVPGQLNFDQELQLISNLDAMLSMDSGNGHLASIFGVPTVTLWGVTHPYAGFSPFGQDPDNALLADREKFPLIPTSVYGNKCPEGYEKAIATIKPETVVSKIEEVLAR